MKKFRFLTAAFLMTGLLCGFQAMAQGRIDLGAAKSVQTCASVTDEGFAATFSFSSIEATEMSTEKGVFSNITMDNTYPSGNLGEPTLPAANKLLAIPYGVGSISVKVKNYTTKEYALADFGIKKLYPQQLPLRKDQKPGDLPFAYSEKAYNAKGYAQRPIAEVNIQGTLRGIQIGALTVNPVQYDPSTNRIRVYNDIEVEVSYSPYDKSAAYNEFARTFSPYFAGIYSQMFNWRDDIYDQHPDLWQAPVKMLVISDRMFEETIQDWLAWKTTKGFYLDVNYTDEIGNNAAAIKSFIQEKYEQDPPTFLMIMGDKAQVAASAIGSETDCVTDLYYMSVDGDEFADIFHSRFPAETVAQMQSMLNKALEYEQYTMPDPSYLNNVLLIAGEDNGWGVQVGRPAIWYGSHYYYNTDHGFENVYEYSHGTYTGCYDHLNTGVGFVNYTAHGSNTSWAGPEFDVNDVNNLTNEHKYFLAIGNCCQAADWGISSTCYGEAMVRAENKAAYAYIGSCPSTYWLNDYYFAVGATNVANGTMPTFEQTTMGCYDAIWMDNAYNTVCAIPFIGNLAGNAAQALGYELHIETLYCWQAYHTLGDGSIMPFRVQPTENSVSHMAIVPIGMATYEVSADPGSYVAISKDGVLHGAGLVDGTGTIVLDIEPILAGGDVTLCVTHPQRIPVVQTIPAAALEGPYIVHDSHEAEHALTPGAYVPLNVTIKNVGADPSGNLTVTLSTESEYVTLLTSEATCGNIAPDASYSIEDVFAFEMTSNVPDKETVQFTVTCTDGTGTWESKFTMTTSAPDFVLANISNTELLPGEQGTITLKIKNNGTGDAQNAHFELFSSFEDLTLSNNVIDMETIAAGDTATFTVDVAVAASVEIGSTYELGYVMAAGHYAISGAYSVTVGNIVEDFETGDFSKFDWQNSGNAEWTIVDSEANTGTYSAKSGDISDNQSSILSLTVEVLADGELSFYKKVSSEGSWDKLFFFIDNQKLGEYSGEQDWQQVTFDVTAGTHTFKWEYKKDVSASSGQDCAWIDDIQFPPTNVFTALDPITDLTADVDGNAVTLEWTAVNEASNYIVRRDGEEVANLPGTTYTDNVEDGIYTYIVIATDGNGHNSAPAYVTVSVGYVGLEEGEVEFSVYPNPVSSTLFINAGNAAYSYAMFNGMGQVVANGNAQGSQQLDVNGFAKGVYFLRLTSGNQVIMRKVVVE